MKVGADIRTLRGQLAGQNVFVLANGPSIATLDLSKLRGLRSIGMNASTLLEQQHGFVSDYYVVSDARFLEHPIKRAYATSLVSPSTVRVLRGDLWEVDDERLRDKTYYVRARGKHGFSVDLVDGYFFGCTTTMLAVQLAAYTQCSTIYLLGCDFKYAGPQPRFYAEEQAQEPDPFLSVQLWNMRHAFVELRKLGIDMFCCSPESNLRPYVPFCSFENALAGSP